MAYQKQAWHNLPAETTPISAERLGHLETQYDKSVVQMGTLLQAHIDDPTPHLAYDVDMPSLTILFENGLA